MEPGWKASGRRTTSGSLVLRGEERPGGTLPETNIAPENQRLEDKSNFLLKWSEFSDLRFRECIQVCLPPMEGYRTQTALTCLFARPFFSVLDSCVPPPTLQQKNIKN